MSIITLISDWGNKDHYAGSVKGSILSIAPDTIIVDISHEVPAFKLYQASFILRSCYKTFPAGTVHIIGVNSEATPSTPYTAVMKDGHYFIGADNGVFSLLFDSTPDKIVEINNPTHLLSTFPGRDVFAPAACHLAQGKPIEDLGISRNAVKELIAFKPVVRDNTIRGMVIYIDAYYNVITNINKTLFDEISLGRPFSINFASYSIEYISNKYSDVPEGEILALFSSDGYLQIAQNLGDAANQLGLGLDSLVVVDFETLK